MRKALMMAIVAVALVSCGQRGPAPQAVESLAFADNTPPAVIFPEFWRCRPS